MFSPKTILPRLSLFLCFLVAIAFSIKNLREPDLWWQIRTGEWILENGQIPHHDIFSYTYNGAPWINVKWGFEIIAAFITKAFSPESIFILQAVISCFIIWVLIKLAPVFSFSKNDDKTALSIAIPIALLITLPAMEYRFNGRPEMFSHLFTTIFLLVLLKHRKGADKKIFWLIPLQILWANLHEAFGIGIVLAAIFCVGAWVEYFLAKRKVFKWTVEMPKTITLLLLGLIASVIINPNGTKLLTRPINILGQIYENKYTTELFDVNTPGYWAWNAYWSVAVLVVAIVGVLFYYRNLKTKVNRFKLFTEHFGVGYLLTVLAFLYLAGTAFRNIIFLLLVFFPVLVSALEVVLDRVKQLTKLALPAFAALCVLTLGLYAFVVSNKYYEVTKSNDRFGLELLSTANPSGAADFIQQQHLTGTCFSDYLTSSYLLWKLQPNFKTFIDLRDLDVFPADFFNTFAEAVTYVESFEHQDSLYHFNYAVVYRPQFTQLHKYLYNESRFKLAYVDAVAAVYVKKDSANYISPVAFSPSHRLSTNAVNTVINKTLNPFFSAYDYNKVDFDWIAANYWLSVGKLDVAERCARKATTNNIDNYTATETLAEVIYNQATHIPDPQQRAALIQQAGGLFMQAINGKPDLPRAYMGLGAVYFEQRNFVLALENFEKSIKYNSNELQAYLLAANCLVALANQNNADALEYQNKALGYYKTADKLNPNNPSIILSLGFLYYRMNDCKNAVGYLKKVAGFDGLNNEQQRQVKECLMRCGG